MEYISNNIKKATVFMLILALNEVIIQLSVAHTMHCYGPVLMRECCHLYEWHKTLRWKVKGRRKNEKIPDVG